MISFNKINILIFYKYFSHDAISKFPVIPDSRAQLCHLIKVKHLASVIYFHVLFTVHFVKACITHRYLVYTVYPKCTCSFVFYIGEILLSILYCKCYIMYCNRQGDQINLPRIVFLGILKHGLFFSSPFLEWKSG